ncbi:hypothetical protein MKX01_015089 [Papaver californicum]|nr:hypothetical protein MKX01_015089 [Papaver californicum]
MGASQVLVKFQCFIFLLLWLQGASAEVPTTASRPIAKPGCRDRCGNVSIPYPFGIGDGCFRDKSFNLTCDLLISSEPQYYGFNISKISVDDGDMTTKLFVATKCSDNNKAGSASASIGKKFTFSNTKNKFIAMGCNTLASLTIKGEKGDIFLISSSYCNTKEDITDGSCTGIGCSVISFPHRLYSYNATVNRLYKTSTERSSTCSYAFLIEESSFNFSSSYLNDLQNHGPGPVSVPVVADWTVGTETCQEAVRNLTSYACGNNSDCTSSNDPPGYRCSCKRGYAGNPYLNINIDECAGNDLCGIGGTCKNTMGEYTCQCKNGYKNTGGPSTECIALPPPPRNPDKLVVGK